MFSKVLIANRGAIVARILRTLHALGIESVVVYAEADRDAPYVHEANHAVSLGDGDVAATYLDIDKLIAIARETGAEAIHPGYGFLSENPDFIAACEQAGMVFLGPTAEQVRAFGYKHRARELASKANVPLVPGSELLTDIDMARQEAERIGYPVMLKSTAGGGGIGMHICRDAEALDASFHSVQQLGERNFGNGSVYLEAYLDRARHLEVQIFGDGAGRVIALGERDCSTQRRNQKVIEETPAACLPSATREALQRTAIALGESINYRSAGTVEFIYDSERDEFYFLEVNTRLQVEHGVTEMVWNVDLVEWMLRLGAGETIAAFEAPEQLQAKGHAIQARIYAEDPLYDFRPSAGQLTQLVLPQGDNLRIDHALVSDMQITALFDPMLAKVIAYAETREQALATLADALHHTQLNGLITNVEWLAAIVADARFAASDIHTRWLADFAWQPQALEVLDAGTLTTIQDYPGRQGYWSVGVPPSGPFDDWSFRLGNRLLENADTAAGIEITVAGPTLAFHHAAQVVVAGAPIEATLDGVELAQWQVVDVAAGQTLTLGRVQAGMRAYLLVRGGIASPRYLGSRSTFTLGQFGGLHGHALRVGDRLPLSNAAPIAPATLDSRLIPELQGQQKVWEIAVIYGPHGAPDFFTEQDIDTFFEHAWEVHYNSSRTGVRLVGPHPQWARSDGGEAGLHPSNIHDNAYAFGTIDFTGDMPIILGPDGPSLGGFVCPATVVRSERWKIGQLAPGDKVRFVPITLEDAGALERRQYRLLDNLQWLPPVEPQQSRRSPVIRSVDEQEPDKRLVYRLAGDDFLLIEFGPMALDIAQRFRAHAWMLWFEQQQIAGVIETTPGIRSLQVHYDAQQLPLMELLATLETAERELRDIEDLEIETREVMLPLSWDDPDCRKAIEHYHQSVRPNAPWYPSNLEFIRRINGLEDIGAVRDVVFEAEYLVMGLGDVYLGAPVATPLDPTQRLVTTKYNPARTWTAENSVGIGGAYLCVYGMEGPGGYQFVGRTLQMWNRYRTTPWFSERWLLRFFDTLRFYEVSHDELMRQRRDFLHGSFELQVRHTTFRLSDYLKRLEDNEAAIQRFREQRDKAFQQEIDDWRANGQFTYAAPEVVETAESALQEGEASIDSPVAGSLWKLQVAVGDEVAVGQTVALIESMKMEIPLVSRKAGTVTQLPVAEGSGLSAGQQVIIVAEATAPTTEGDQP
ncbi:urea carboxylase [Carnimonas bestiolae]|uniref:urea carboxylase n=1 Tax=Carnimonas bestiolae TaxID=3402172 RepID=UPI003EDBD418